MGRSAQHRRNREAWILLAVWVLVGFALMVLFERWGLSPPWNMYLGGGAGALLGVIAAKIFA